VAAVVDPGPLSREPAHPWEQIARRISDAISSGALSPGQQLDSEKTFCETYGVARMTVRRALEHLRDEGLIESRPGVGWFVVRR
jgi:GntR family transcriptional regulator